MSAWSWYSSILAKVHTMRALVFVLVCCLFTGVGQANEKKQEQLGVAREMVGLLEAYAVYKMGQYDLALERFRVLAAGGSLKAMYNLGNMHADGLGVPQSDEKAFEWYMKASKEGDALSMEALADAYEDGLGTDASPQQASYWRRQAEASN